MNNPFSIWKKNKFRIDLRNFTRKFQQNFLCQERHQIVIGKVYASTYINHELLTDKHHITPLFLSFGKFRDDNGKICTRGLNLFYLRNDQQIEILEEAFSYLNIIPEKKVVPFIKIHEKWMKITPYAFVNLEDQKIKAIKEICSTEWGMIPLLHTHLIGNFNAAALNEDFKKENLVKPKKISKRISKKKQTAIKSTENKIESTQIEQEEIDFNLEDI